MTVITRFWKSETVLLTYRRDGEKGRAMTHKTDQFAIRLISSGKFVDEDPGSGGAKYMVQTYTFRMNRAAVSEWLKAFSLLDNWHSGEDWEVRHPSEDMQAYQEEQKKQQAALESKIADALQADISADDSFCIRQVVSEIFTAVHISKIK